MSGEGAEGREEKKESEVLGTEDCTNDELDVVPDGQRVVTGMTEACLGSR